MVSTAALVPRRDAFADLRVRLANAHAMAAPEAFTLAEEAVLRTGLPALDAALGGGVPRGTIATLEGRPGSGRSAVAARVLAIATQGGGLAALVESPAGPEGAFYPPSLEAAGVDLARLLVVPAGDAAATARAADILLRAKAFGLIVIPALRLPAAAWTRLAGLAHRSNAVLLALGNEASDELRYFASLRVRLQTSRPRWLGRTGLFCALAGAELEAMVVKHKRAAPGRSAALRSTSFEAATGVPMFAGA